MLGVQDVRVHAPAHVDLSTYPLQFSLSCGPLRVAWSSDQPFPAGLRLPDGGAALTVTHPGRLLCPTYVHEQAVAVGEAGTQQLTNGWAVEVVPDDEVAAVPDDEVAAEEHEGGADGHWREIVERLLCRHARELGREVRAFRLREMASALRAARETAADRLLQLESAHEAAFTAQQRLQVKLTSMTVRAAAGERGAQRAQDLRDALTQHQDERHGLVSHLRSLTEEHERLRAEHLGLQDEHIGLQEEHRELREEYRELQELQELSSVDSVGI